MICVFPSHLIAQSPKRACYMCLTPADVDHVRAKWASSATARCFW